MPRPALLTRSLLLGFLGASVLVLQAQSSPAPAAGVETGDISGARFRIEIPPNWNRGLVLYAHGYEPVWEKRFFQDTEPAALVRQVFLSRGFAYAESAYRARGWAVKEAIEDTETLRQHFVRKHGQPAETYIVGHSMGGHITMAIIERYPDAYQGAMPMCGPLGAAVDFFNTGLLDMLVTFEALFPGSIGSPYEPTEKTAPNVAAAIGRDPARAARYAARFSRPVEQLPAVLAFYHYIMGELKARAGGEPFDNRNRVYVGFGDDLSLNRLVKRYAADPKAREYIRQYATPTGRTQDPILALHTTFDPIVLGSDVTAYELPATLAGSADRFVVRFAEAVGHCQFTPEQTGNAFDALRAWAKDGKRPEPGEQR
jgi:pimeloyl-ACP methyl ester carboxylesterase